MSQPGGYRPPQVPGPPPGYGGPPPGYGYPPQAYGQQGAYGQGGPGQGGYGPAGTPGGPGRPPGSRNGLVIMGIVVAAIVLLVAVGGIFLTFGAHNSAPTTTLTPTAQPTEPFPTSSPSRPPSTSAPTTSPTSGPHPSTPPASSGSAVSLGHGIALTPASGWKLAETRPGLAVLERGSQEQFVGQSGALAKGTNPATVVNEYHKQIGDKYPGTKYTAAKAIDLGNAKVHAATGSMQVTVSTGGGTSEVVVVSVASVRASDGVTVLGTLYFFPSSDTTALNTEFSQMLSSMLRGQVGG